METKWENLQPTGAGYFITLTTRNFIPLFTYRKVREIVYQGLTSLEKKYPCRIAGYRLIPDCAHLLIQAEGDLDVSKIMADFKRVTAGEIYRYFEENQDHYWLGLLKAGAYKRHAFSAWQENFHSEIIYNDHLLQEKLDYLHNDPVRCGMIGHAVDRPHSSISLYHADRAGALG